MQYEKPVRTIKDVMPINDNKLSTSEYTCLKIPTHSKIKLENIFQNWFAQNIE